MNWDLKQRFDSPFGQVAYDVEGDGPSLVMIHGTPFSSFVWRRFVPVLREHYRVHFYDLVGYGQSEMTAGADVSLGVQSKVLAALLRHWKIERPTVIAHDFGGATTLRAHFLEDCDYKQMLLIDPVAVAPWGSPFVQHVRQYPAAFEGLPAYIHDGVLNAYLQDAAFHPLAADARAAYKAPWQGEAGQAAFYRQIAQMDQKYTDAVQPMYGDVRCPVSLVWGADDRWVPLARGETLHELMPGASLTVIEGAGHLVQEDQPERLLAVIRGRLDLLP